MPPTPESSDEPDRAPPGDADDDGDQGHDEVDGHQAPALRVAESLLTGPEIRDLVHVELIGEEPLDDQLLAPRLAHSEERRLDEGDDARRAGSPGEDGDLAE